MIIGTAGHIDHGKTTLIRALTGVDTDRLPEEKRRGITIELGFAPLRLEPLGTLGVVDVPGHESFVRTMVAGATGIDLALLVIAADEGIMPQTREHLAILSLLGTRGGVVALTKCDLVDQEWLELVRGDVQDAVHGTPLEGARVVAVSAATGDGLDALRAALAEAARRIAPRDVEDVFRMPIDRAFSVRGTGTVVTGTIWSGSVSAESTVVLQPAGRELRVRGVQSHGRDVAFAGPATRAAIALAGVEVAAVERGAWLVGDAQWPPTTRLRAEVTLLPTEARSLRPREWVRLHLGTSDVAARIVAVGGPVAPGEQRATRVVVQEPVVAQAGDRFVLRRASPPATIGGGIVTDPLPPRRRARAWPPGTGSVPERLQLFVQEAGDAGLELSTLYIRLGVKPADVGQLVRDTRDLEEAGRRVFARSQLARVMDEMRRAVEAHHARSPLDDGMPTLELKRSVGAAPELVDRALEALAEASLLVVRGSNVAWPGWQPSLSPEQLQRRNRILFDLRSAGVEPPSVSELTEVHHSDVTRLLRMLEREGLVVAVEPDRYYDAESLAALIGKLRDGMTRGREYSPAEIRDLVGLSRKYLIPFLEYCDRLRITERREGGRVFLDT
jgi:selenocysteine-specific elongation factor